MTLKVTFDLPLQVESQIRRTLKRNNKEQARRLIYDALEPGVEDLLSQLNEPVRRCRMGGYRRGTVQRARPQPGQRLGSAV